MRCFFFSAILLGMSAAQAGSGPEPLPASHLLQAITQGERQLEAQKRETHLRQQVSPVLWEPTARPEAIRSWLYFNLSPESWQRLQRNVSEKGRPLL